MRYVCVFPSCNLEKKTFPINNWVKVENSEKRVLLEHLLDEDAAFAHPDIVPCLCSKHRHLHLSADKLDLMVKEEKEQSVSLLHQVCVCSLVLPLRILH
jgi:hypothetical protein